MSDTALGLLDPTKTALVVIDLQNAFCHRDGTLGQSGVDTDRLGSVIAPIRRLVETFKAADMPVLWTVQEHFATDHRRARKRLPSHTSKRKQVSALAGSWDAAIVDELADLATDPSLIIRKHRFGGFYETRMAIVLDMLGVEALVVTGLTTNACVETTIREAYLRDYDVVGVSDACAGVNAEWEAVAQQVWRQYLAVSATAQEVIDWVEATRAPRALAIHHMLLKVPDLDVAKQFYCGLLGFAERANTKPLADGRAFISTVQGLGIVGGGPDRPDQIDHMAFRVQGLAALNAKLKAAGVEFDRELGPGPYGPSIYVKDPYGNILELFE